MHMTYWWSTVFDDFFIKGCNISTLTSLICTCSVLSLLAFFIEYLKYLQVKLRQKELYLRAQQIRSICPPDENVTLLIGRSSRTSLLDVSFLNRFVLRTYDIFLWLNLQVIGYFLMLVAMTYNGWMTISLILGSGLGYFCFGIKYMKLNAKNYQIIRDAFCSMTCPEAAREGQSTPVLEASQSSASVAENCRTTVACVH